MEGRRTTSMCTAQAHADATADAIGAFTPESPHTLDRILAAIEKTRTLDRR
jgi:hypothetical protein